MDKDGRRADLVQTVVQLAKNLQMKVIAEGVESIEELAALEKMGCDLIQGFLFSKPLPPASVDALLRTRPGLPERTAYTKAQTSQAFAEPLAVVCAQSPESKVVF